MAPPRKKGSTPPSMPAVGPTTPGPRADESTPPTLAELDARIRRLERHAGIDRGNQGITMKQVHRLGNAFYSLDERIYDLEEVLGTSGDEPKHPLTGKREPDATQDSSQPVHVTPERKP